jgi:CheY-like chemotaxis protein
MHGPILVIDDEPDIRDALVTVLASEGHDAVAAADGREALQLLREGLRPCLILLDLMMPVMNGWEFRVQQRDDPDLAAIPTVVVSAAGMDAIRAVRADAVLPKPIDVDRLLEILGGYCAERGRAR